MINFAQLCYCIYYENYYNSFIMKTEKQFLSDGSGVYSHSRRFTFGYGTAVISGAEQALQKTFWD